jgi:hypothetical protein
MNPAWCLRSFMDPAFDEVAGELAAVEEVALANYRDLHKAPVTRKAGPGFADPDYDLSVEWIAASGAKRPGHALAGAGD